MNTRTKKIKTHKFRTAGYDNEDFLCYTTGTWQCGHIKDGISLSHTPDGVWVLAYKDLMKIAQIATKERQKNSEPLTAG